MTVEGEADPLRERMIAARARPAVIKTRFIAFRSAFPKGTVLAVEGDDDKVVYSHWIARLNPELAYEFFVCGGKRSAGRLSAALSRDAGELSADVLFLVDRDFDDLAQFPESSNVFMLDRYSVENYLVTREVLDGCLQIAFPCHGQVGVRESICDLFEEVYGQFLDVTREVNRRVFIGRKLGLDLDDVIPDTIARMAVVHLHEVTPGEDTAEAVIPFEEPDEATTSQLSAEFENLNPRERYRGKFALKFFSQWLDRLSAEYRNSQIGLFASVANDSKPRYSELTMGPLASRSPMPSELAQFIEMRAAA